MPPVKTLLALAVLLGFGAAGALLWNYLRNRPEIEIRIYRPPNAPFADAVCSGFQLALEESGSRAGKVRVRSSLMVVAPDDASEFYFTHAKGITPFQTEYPRACIHLLAGREQMAEAVFAWAKREGLKVTELLTEPDDTRSLLLKSAIHTVWKVQGSGEPLILHAGESAPFSSAAKTFKFLKASGYKGRFLVFDAHPEVSCVDAPGQPEDGMLLVTPIFPPPADFIPRYRAYAGKDPGPHVYGGYLTGKAALDLIARARSTSPEDLLAAASKIRPHPPALYVARGGRFHFVELLSFPAR